AACESGPYPEDDTGHGSRDHRPWLDDAGTPVVSCPAAPLDTPEAARASFTGISMPDQALVFVTTVQCLSLPKTFEPVSNQHAFNEGMQGVHPVPERLPSRQAISGPVEMPAQAPDGQGDLAYGLERAA